MSQPEKKVTLDDYLNRTLTQEEAEKLDSGGSDRESYAPTLDMAELKLYKLKLLEEIREVEGDYGPSQVVEVQNLGDNAKYTLWLPTVLYRKLRRHKASTGTVVGVIYKGKPQGKRYKDYATFIWTDEFAAHLGLKPGEAPTF